MKRAGITVNNGIYLSIKLIFRPVGPRVVSIPHIIDKTG